MTTIIVIIPVFMFILSSINLLLTIKYQNDSRRIDSLRSQRDKIQIYAEKVITDCRIYLESQLLYVNERKTLEHDKQQNHIITSNRSAYVYQLKDTMKHNRIQLQVTTELMRIEIANSEFPNVQKCLHEMFISFRVYTGTWEDQRIETHTQQEIDLYTERANERIQAMVNLFGRTQNQLTQSIHNTNLYADIMMHLKHRTIDPLFEPINDVITKKRK